MNKHNNIKKSFYVGKNDSSTLYIKPFLFDLKTKKNFEYLLQKCLIICIIVIDKVIDKEYEEKYSNEEC